MNKLDNNKKIQILRRISREALNKLKELAFINTMSQSEVLDHLIMKHRKTNKLR